ncbi:MAG: family 43 glycosylhydrolase [Microbacterium sp.]|uniref:glycoside hydrolase family 43 protein n=1 Tax=Microbacterium sp. TaxID=51671 RepID=UPI001D1EAE11|nr:glycoside hydrolase family 43 protein [Microbacterium sp.]MBW8764216.1 family 43 glycosylhydrolase [Microbacterium sp.]
MTLVRNPILPGCHPDPSICRVDGEYFVVTSSFEYLPGLPIHRSTDLARWELIGHAVDRPGMLDMAGMASSSGLYAPTLRHHDGLFWVICTLVDQNDPARGGNFVITATDPAGPWSEPVWLGADGIDPSLFFDDDGRAWVQGTRLARSPQWHDQTEIWLREFDPEARALTGPEHVIWRGALIGAVWAEGPHLYKVDGRYHLVAAEGGTEMHHAVSVARADAVTGPYVGNPANPVLSHRQLGRTADVVAVGHADLVQAADDSWWAVLLGMRPYGGLHANLGRETFLVPVEWEDGWPVFAPGEGRVPDQVEVPFAGEGRQERSATIAPDDGRWTSVRALPGEVADAVDGEWLLPIRPEGPTDPQPFAFLGVRQQHPDLDFTLRMSGRLAPGEETGLLIRQSERDHVRLAVLGGGEADAARITATLVRAGGSAEQGTITLTGPLAEGVELTCRARGQDYELLAGVEGSQPLRVATVDGTSLDSFSSGGFLGLWLGAYATSVAAETDSVVRVARVEYHPR